MCSRVRRSTFLARRGTVRFLVSGTTNLRCGLFTAVPPSRVIPVRDINELRTAAMVGQCLNLYFFEGARALTSAVPTEGSRRAGRSRGDGRGAVGTGAPAATGRATLPLPPWCAD